MSDEKVRSSVEGARDSALPVLPTVNPNIKRSQQAESASFHPAVYISTWIGLSSSVIIFNKYILDRANFRRLPLHPQTSSHANHRHRLSYVARAHRVPVDTDSVQPSS